jgi:hypothetical protein
MRFPDCETRSGHVIGALFWGAVMFGCAAISAGLQGWHFEGRTLTVLCLFAAGGFIAFPIAFGIARRLSAGRSRETEFAAMFAALSILTVGMTALLFALQYRQYYSEWHADTFSKIWFLQFAFTIAGAFFQFAVLGLRLYGLLGILALFSVSLWFAAQTR